MQYHPWQRCSPSYPLSINYWTAKMNKTRGKNSKRVQQDTETTTTEKHLSCLCTVKLENLQTQWSVSSLHQVQKGLERNTVHKHIPEWEQCLHLWNALLEPSCKKKKTCSRFGVKFGVDLIFLFVSFVRFFHSFFIPPYKERFLSSRLKKELQWQQQ